VAPLNSIIKTNALLIVIILSYTIDKLKEQIKQRTKLHKSHLLSSYFFWFSIHTLGFGEHNLAHAFLLQHKSWPAINFALKFFCSTCTLMNHIYELYMNMSCRASTLFKSRENIISRIVQVPKYDGVSGIYAIYSIVFSCI
jgi:hypothetical protein